MTEKKAYVVVMGSENGWGDISTPVLVLARSEQEAEALALARPAECDQESLSSMHHYDRTDERLACMLSAEEWLAGADVPIGTTRAAIYVRTPIAYPLRVRVACGAPLDGTLFAEVRQSADGPYVIITAAEHMTIPPHGAGYDNVTAAIVAACL